MTDAPRGPSTPPDCWVYAVIMDPSRLRDREGILARNPRRDTAKPFIRVARLPGVWASSQIFRRCPFHGKVALLEGSAVSYGSDGIRSRLEVGLAMERELVDQLRRQGWTVVNPPPKADCSVYVIELDRSVRSHRDVKRANPHSDPLMACLYVGQTRRTPEERYTEHNDGKGLKKGGRHLRGKCLRLRPDLFEVFNPMPLLESLVLERELAQELREKGFTVLGGH